MNLLNSAFNSNVNQVKHQERMKGISSTYIDDFRHEDSTEVHAAEKKPNSAVKMIIDDMN